MRFVHQVTRDQIGLDFPHPHRRPHDHGERPRNRKRRSPRAHEQGNRDPQVLHQRFPRSHQEIRRVVHVRLPERVHRNQGAAVLDGELHESFPAFQKHAVLAAPRQHLLRLAPGQHVQVFVRLQTLLRGSLTRVDAPEPHQQLAVPGDGERDGGHQVAPLGDEGWKFGHEARGVRHEHAVVERNHAVRETREDGPLAALRVRYQPPRLRCFQRLLVVVHDPRLEPRALAGADDDVQTAPPLEPLPRQGRRVGVRVRDESALYERRMDGQRVDGRRGRRTRRAASVQQGWHDRGFGWRAEAGRSAGRTKTATCARRMSRGEASRAPATRLEDTCARAARV